MVWLLVVEEAVVAAIALEFLGLCGFVSTFLMAGCK